MMIRLIARCALTTLMPLPLGLPLRRVVWILVKSGRVSRWLLKLHHPLAGPIIGTRREVAHIRTLMRNIILAGGVVVLVVEVFIMVEFLKMIISLSSLGCDRYDNHYYETPRHNSTNRHHH